MVRFARPAATLAALLALGPVAACGGGSPPARWAADVCAALSPWRARIQALNAQAQQQLAAATGPAQARAGLLELLRGAQEASETARAALVAAGVPDTPGGAEIAASFTASLATIRDAYARARRDLELLPEQDATAFYDRVIAIFGQLSRDYAAASPDPDQVGSTDLRRAFEEVEQCR